MKYKCTSKNRFGTECQYSCEVDVPFKPRACLIVACWEEWEELQTSDETGDKK